MNVVARRIFKVIIPVGLWALLLLGALFGNYSLSLLSPAELQFIAREIQAACRDAGTQWMVAVCLLSYLIVFIVLEAKSQVSGLKSKVASESEVKSRHPSPVTRHVFRNPNFWLCAFVVLVLLRYAFDYVNAARSLQVVVLLTGIVVGKGIGLWADWGKPRTLNFEPRTLNAAEVGREEVVGDEVTSRSGEALLTSCPTINSQLSTLNKAQAVLSILILLLASASLWHPERGMLFFYRGQPRWTGPWDNPNLYGVLMGVGTVLALGLLVSRLKSKDSSRGAKVESREPEEVGRGSPLPAPLVTETDGAHGVTRPTINSQPKTINCSHWLRAGRFLFSVFLLSAFVLCGIGLLKSYSRGAWLGTAVGIGFLIWKWIAHLTQNPHPQPLSHPLGEGGVGLSPRPSGGEGESYPRLSDSEPQFATRNSQPSTSNPIRWFKTTWFQLSVFLLSAFILSFWQFRHTESPVARRVFSVGNPNDFSWRNRVSAWQGAGRMMWDKPLAGFGWGKAEEVYSKEYRAARLEESAAIQLNDYLTVGISAGVPALGCLLVYLWLALSRRSSVERREPDELSTFNFQPSTIAAAGAIVLLIGFWFDGGLFKLPTCVVFWMLVELAHGSRRGNEAESLTAMPAGGASVRASRLVSSLAPPTQGSAHGMTRHLLALRWLAGLFALAALGLTGLQLGTPQLAVSERTLSIARNFLVPPKEKADFEFLAAKPIWSGQPLKVLLQHAHLANYNRSLVNWKLDDELYREFVLSPELLVAADVSLLKQNAEEIRADSRRLLRDGEGVSTPLSIHSQPSTNLNWRRPLWEYFYPRIRKESSLEAAGEIIVRQLNDVCRRRGGETNPTPDVVASKCIPEIWQRGAANEREFQIVSVAALRSAGIPARLTVAGAAEFWNGTEWKVAPRLGSGSAAGK
jgi:hypothetical protein